MCVLPAQVRRGVQPGSFIDLLMRAKDKTTGRGFTDMEIANQVCAPRPVRKLDVAATTPCPGATKGSLTFSRHTCLCCDIGLWFLAAGLLLILAVCEAPRRCYAPAYSMFTATMRDQ